MRRPIPALLGLAACQAPDVWECGNGPLIPNLALLERDLSTPAIRSPDVGGSSETPSIWGPDGEGRLFAATSDGVVFRARDEGCSWEPVTQLPDPPGWNGIASGGVSRIFDSHADFFVESGDGGTTWEEVPLDEPITGLPWVNPEDPDHLITITSSALRISQDGGRTWSSRPTPVASETLWNEDELGVARGGELIVAGLWELWVSEDGGQDFDDRTPALREHFGKNARIASSAVSGEGDAVWAVVEGGDDLRYLARSDDLGRSWNAILSVGAELAPWGFIGADPQDPELVVVPVTGMTSDAASSLLVFRGDTLVNERDLGIAQALGDVVITPHAFLVGALTLSLNLDTGTREGG
jgi:hypothetical protein